VADHTQLGRPASGTDAGLAGGGAASPAAAGGVSNATTNRGAAGGEELSSAKSGVPERLPSGGLPIKGEPSLVGEEVLMGDSLAWGSLVGVPGGEK